MKDIIILTINIVFYLYLSVIVSQSSLKILYRIFNVSAQTCVRLIQVLNASDHQSVTSWADGVTQRRKIELVNLKQTAIGLTVANQKNLRVLALQMPVVVVVRKPHRQERVKERQSVEIRVGMVVIKREDLVNGGVQNVESHVRMLMPMSVSDTIFFDA